MESTGTFFVSNASFYEVNYISLRKRRKKHRQQQIEMKHTRSDGKNRLRPSWNLHKITSQNRSEIPKTGTRTTSRNIIAQSGPTTFRTYNFQTSKSSKLKGLIHKDRYLSLCAAQFFEKVSYKRSNLSTFSRP